MMFPGKQSFITQVEIWHLSVFPSMQALSLSQQTTFGTSTGSSEKHYWSRKLFKACKANKATAQAFQFHLYAQVSQVILATELAWHNGKYSLQTEVTQFLNAFEASDFIFFSEEIYMH